LPPTPIGTSLRAARERLGWTREALAHRAGISWAAIAQIETGRRRDVRASSLVALAAALGVSLEQLAGVATAAPRVTLRHQALVYEGDAELLAVTVPFLTRALAGGEAAIAVTTPARIRLLREALGGQADRVDFFGSAGWYSSPVAALSRYRGWLEEQVAGGAPWARIIGEPVWIGRSGPEIADWVRYESLINISFAASPATIMCPYDAQTAPAEVLEHARRTHPELAHGDGALDSPSYVNPEALLLGQAPGGSP
jgi:transcriptional regulator with XRE-family HTH domain